MENKNYYDLLEISKKASPEVIEKAYKALVKKYHPDLYEGDKLEAEEIIKKINEAYDVLSDSNKRAKYDATLTDDNISKEDYDKLQQELNSLKHNQNFNQNYTNQARTTPNYSNLKQQPQPSNFTSSEDLEYKRQLELEKQRQQELQTELEYQRQVEAAKQKAYHDAYIQDLRNRGYKIRYKKSFKDYVRIVITILVLIAFAWIAWQIPFIRNWFVDLYNSNEVIKFIVDLFKNKTS